MFGQLTFLLDSVSRAACLPARAAAGAYLRSAYRGMACSLAGDQQMPRIVCVGLLLPESGEVMWTWNCRRLGRAYALWAPAALRSHPSQCTACPPTAPARLRSSGCRSQVPALASVVNTQLEFRR